MTYGGTLCKGLSERKRDADMRLLAGDHGACLVGAELSVRRLASRPP